MDDKKNSPVLRQSIIRFALVGVANTLIDIGIYSILRNQHLGIYLANLCSTTVALTFSFLVNRRYTFQAHGQALHRQVIRFVPVTLVALWVIQPLFIYLLTPATNHLLMDHRAKIIVPKLGATFVSLVWNFVLYRSYVFAEPRPRPD